MMSRVFQVKSVAMMIFAVAFLQACGQSSSNNNSGRRQGATQNKPVTQTGTSNGVPGGENTGSAPVTPQELPAPAGLAVMRPVPGAAVGYDFMGVLTRDSASAAVVRMIIQKSALSSARKVKVTGTMVNLRASSKTIPVDRDVDVTAGGVIDFTVSGLTADTVYRMNNVSVADISTGSAQGGSVSVKDPYFLATTATGSRVSQSRRLMTLRALSEAYDWDHGNYDNSKGYARGWGWCDAFYTWVASRDFKMNRNYGSTSFFDDYNALGNASRVPKLGATDNLAGDLIRYEGTSEGTHTFMVVAWDNDTRKIWSVEGNFNRRVLRNERNLDSPWVHGHLEDDQVK